MLNLQSYGEISSFLSDSGVVSKRFAQQIAECQRRAVAVAGYEHRVVHAIASARRIPDGKKAGNSRAVFIQNPQTCIDAEATGTHAAQEAARRDYRVSEVEDATVRSLLSGGAARP